MNETLDAFGTLIDDAARDSQTRPSAHDPRKSETAADGGSDEVHLIQLNPREGGPLTWTERPPARDAASGRKWIRTLSFDSLDSNPITKVIAGLDHRLTPARDLRRLGDAGFQPLDDASSLRGKRVLLIIHGTFSNSEAILRQLARSERLLPQLKTHYDAVIAYDYPTLSAPAFASALRLHRLTHEFGKVDILAHSQGGLVARWFTEAFAPQRLRDGSRIVLVGGTLQGTSLAAPDGLGNLIDYLTSISYYAAKVIDLLVPPSTLLSGIVDVIGLAKKSLGTLTRLSAGAAIELVPGLAGMSRVRTNAGLEQLVALAANDPPSGYRTITSQFEPRSESWRFRDLFYAAKGRALATTASMIFPHENDLVVDCESSLTPSPGQPADPARNVVIASSPTVHHTNYFETASVQRQIATWLLGER